MISGAIVMTVVTGFYARHQWYGDGYATCQAEHLKATVTMKEKYDEIATHRPDTAALIGSLRAGKF